MVTDVLAALWRFQWWRYFCLQVCRYCPLKSLRDWVFISTGLGDALMLLANRAGHYDHAQQIRRLLTQLRAANGCHHG